MNMKRKITLLVGVILCLSLAACSKAPVPEQSPQENDAETTSTESTEQMQQQSDNSGSTTEKPEDIPAIDNDEDVAYPGADVVEIVNPRGDKTTVYKLADGTYMDREERPFTYNGTDTWTDENGTEWNEVAKD